MAASACSLGTLGVLYPTNSVWCVKAVRALRLSQSHTRPTSACGSGMRLHLSLHLCWDMNILGVVS